MNDEGWKQVKGKSTSKHLVGTSQERAQGDFNNCFSPLQETNFQQVFEAAMDVVEWGQNSRHGGDKTPDSPLPKTQ